MVYGYRRLARAPIYDPGNAPQPKNTATRDLHWIDCSKDRIKILNPFELLFDQDCVSILVNYAEVYRLAPPLSRFRGCSSCPSNPEGTVIRLRRALSAGQLNAKVIEENGDLTSVPARLGNTERIVESMWAGSPLSFRLGARDVSGVPIVASQDLKRFCAIDGRNPLHNPYEPKNVGGRPPKFDQRAFLDVVDRLLTQGFKPTTPAQLRAKALDAFSASLPRGVEPPSDEWAKPIIRQYWQTHNC
jgi:hypothetical protein